MCDHCSEAKKKIERYRWLAANVVDRAALEAANRLAEEQEKIIASLHPNPER